MTGPRPADDLAARIAAVPGVLDTFPERSLAALLPGPLGTGRGADRTGSGAEVLTARIAIDRHARPAAVIEALTTLASGLDPAVERLDIEIAEIR